MGFGDKGIRYDERCGSCRKVTDVCNDCGGCERHCSCEQDAADAAEVAEFEKAHPGFLGDYQKHMEQGSQEH
jgi:hypothetical protein